MQDILSFAQKNNVQLLGTGNCQFCGAICSKGVFECIENYTNLLDFLEQQSLREHFTRFMSIDAHALQHSEIHGRWSNHFHLTRLFLVLENNVVWDYKKSPQLSNHLKEYKIKHSNEKLQVPSLFDRGNINSTILCEINQKEGTFTTIRNWAESVFEAWKSNRDIIQYISEGFLKKLKYEK